MTVNLQAERLNRGLTIREAAEAAGVAPSVVARAENGQTLAPGNAKRIADFYGLKVTDIWPVEEVAA